MEQYVEKVIRERRYKKKLDMPVSVWTRNGIQVGSTLDKLWSKLGGGPINGKTTKKRERPG